MSDDAIVPSWQDAADRWMNAYLTVKDERDELKERLELLAPLLAAVAVLDATIATTTDAAIAKTVTDVVAAFRAFREQDDDCHYCGGKGCVACSAAASR